MRRIVCFLLVLALATITLTACGDTQQFDRIDVGSVKHITVSTVAGQEPNYDIVKRKGLAPLVDIYNSARYTEADDVKAEDLLKDTVYTFCFYDYDGEIVAECAITPEGYLFLKDDLKTVYKMTNSFDEEEVKEVLLKYDVNSPK